MYIELHRTFHELSPTLGPGSDDEPLFPSGEKFDWTALLEEQRVVVLSEAGSGKTAEIREAAKSLRKKGKAAFFLRLEHVASDFEIAFEEGTLDEFQSWIASSEPGWLLLDSVDESRLKDPSDFERAIRKVSFRLASAKQRTHLFITARTAAWRPITDLALCESQFPCLAPTVAVGRADEADRSNSLRTTERRADQATSAFKVVALDDLSQEQVKLFATRKGVADTKAFLEAVERADAWSFTARPQDLEELTEFWNEAACIGSRIELMRKSIDRRLKERDQTRDEARPLALERAREGARIIAAAATLMKEQIIRVPDGTNNPSGLKCESVLTAWTSIDCLTLLARPLFDEAIYGSVRFHHRSVREYLAAEWFAGLLAQETSRRRVEQLFFRTQYGIEVVVPSLRPILPWLAILDPRILDRVRRVAPEIFFEGGDPSQLPLDVRRQILRQACKQLASGAWNRSMSEYAAVQRFAAADLTEDVKELLAKYETNEEIQFFLLRMIWQGRLHGALREASDVALSARSGHYARIAAFRAVADLGSKEDMARVRRVFAKEAEVVDRELLAELLSDAEPTKEVLDWLCDCLLRVADVEVHSFDRLGSQLSSFVNKGDATDIAFLIERFSEFLETPPFVEHLPCEFSVRYKWLLNPAGKAVGRLLNARDLGALNPGSLSILRLLPIAGLVHTSGFDHSKLELEELVGAWQPLKWALFWHIIGEKRRWLETNRRERLTDWRRALWPSYVSFECSDFDRAVRHIEEHPAIDDKLVALTLAFSLYEQGGRQPAQRKLLNKVALSEAELAARLKDLKQPPPQSAEALKYKRINSDWQRRANKQRLREMTNREGWRKHLLDNAHLLDDPSFEDPKVIRNEHQYLLHQMLQGSSTTWSQGNWQVLEVEFGIEVARAFRNGVVSYWRRYRPELLSEGAARNETPVATILGLTGLTIEATETGEWPKLISEAEAEVAFRYAMHQLNGFPPWFASLFPAHGGLLARLMLSEISYELANESDESSGSQYLLYDLAWTGDWLWNTFAPNLYELLKAREPKNERNLSYMLDIIQGSDFPDSRLSELAALKVAAIEKPEHVARWLAVWTGIAPGAAIDALENRLRGVGDVAERTKFAMIYVTQLFGGRLEGSSKVRNAYRAPQPLKRLYLLIHQHVRREEDIERANKGVYSPGLRDDAQDARERLLVLLRAIPGKEAFLALQEISRAHPDDKARPWLALEAKSKAELDAESEKWSADQVRDFNEQFERTPANHRELFELAVDRLLDLKADLEEGDSSYASILRNVSDEIEVRKFIGKWCRDSSRGRYSLPQEEELADAKRPDFRWHGNGFDGPVPTELKLADNWTGSKLFERLEAQLGGDYLRDVRSNRGIFLLVYRGDKANWELPGNGERVDFQDLVASLQDHWQGNSENYPGVDEIRVIGIDLTKRSKPPGEESLRADRRLGQATGASS